MPLGESTSLDLKESVMPKQPSLYILTSKKEGTLYIGVTSDLIKRVYEHKNNLVEGFTRQYGIHHLVYYELHQTMEDAILREKQMKKWKREYKINLIEENNKSWQDLYNDIL